MKTLETMTEQELAEFCTAAAKAVESAARICDVEKPLFVLVMFNDPRVAQYISNCRREDTIAAMRETADRLQRRQDVPR